jgi:hypothetical protein
MHHLTRSPISIFTSHGVKGYVALVLFLNTLFLFSIFLYNKTLPQQQPYIKEEADIRTSRSTKESGLFSNQLAQSRNTKRKSDVNAILNAVGQYSADNNGLIPSGITDSVGDIKKSEVDLCTELVPNYLAGVPRDPSVDIYEKGAVIICDEDYETGYTVRKDSVGKITVSAPNAELGEVISVAR